MPSRGANALDQLLAVDTQSSAIVLFDPHELEHRREADPDWWIGRRARSDVACGRLVIVDGAWKGRYRVRITSGELRPAEVRHVAGIAKGALLQVTSGVVHCTAGERVPAAGRRSGALGRQILRLASGRYQVQAYAFAGGALGIPDLVLQLRRFARGRGRTAAVQLAPWRDAARRGRTRELRAASARKTFPVPAHDLRLSVSLYTPPLVVLLDPAGLSHRRRQSGRWYRDPSAPLAEAARGRLVVVGMQAYDRAASVVVTTQTDGPWRSKVTATQTGWLRVASGRIFSGQADALPRDGKIPDAKGFFPPRHPVGRYTRIAKGDYRVDVHALGRDRKRPAFVFVLSPLDGPPPAAPSNIIDPYLGRPLGRSCF
jgi:hypothetical protein